MSSESLHEVPQAARYAGLTLIVLAVFGLIGGLINPVDPALAARSVLWLAVLGTSAVYLWRGKYADLVHRKGLRGYLRVAVALWFLGGTLGALMSFGQLGATAAAERGDGFALAMGLFEVVLSAACLLYGGYHLSKLVRSAQRIATAGAQPV
jgi:hypothetical protein